MTGSSKCAMWLLKTLHSLMKAKACVCALKHARCIFRRNWALYVFCHMKYNVECRFADTDGYLSQTSNSISHSMNWESVRSLEKLGIYSHKLQYPQRPAYGPML